jgi:hypothetical protein
MWTVVLGFGLLAMLAAAVLPVPRVRRLLLTGSARLVQGAALAFLGACAAFFVCPDAAPAWVRDVLAPVLEGTRGLLPAPGGAPSGWPWLAVAALAVGVSLPFLIAVELAAGLSTQSALVLSLRKELTPCWAWNRAARCCCGRATGRSSAGASIT